jgi:hypothetical protein
MSLCKVQTPERIGLDLLPKNLTGSAELVKVRQKLCRVGDSSNIPNGILLDVKNFQCAVYAFPSIGIIHRFSRLVTLLFHKWLHVRLNHKDACILTLT